MFGEHESESPRVPSPWDPFLPSPPDSTPPQASPALHNGIPKLVPEVEEGNVEYKLKLTNISNARFDRLVTQLKWRLLEGGGQAYYELGVADSGALIGLSRPDLEESLSTLEMMAGEIGASVIVVKEIDVPPTIAALADKDSGYTDPDTGQWARKMRRRGPPPSAAGEQYSTTATTSTTEDDPTDTDEPSYAPTPGATPPISIYVRATPASQRPARTNPERPTAQSSPFIAPLDDDLALFSMEPEPAFRDSDDADATASGSMGDDELELPPPRYASFAGLEISAVYKPRPVRHRTRPGDAAGLGGRHGSKRPPKPKEKKVQPWHQNASANANGPGPGSAHTRKGPKPPAGPQLSKEEKALQRRLARDKKREEKRAALIAHAEGAARPGSAGADGLVEMATRVLAAEIGREAHTLAEGAGALHAAVEGGKARPEEGTSPVDEARQLLADGAGACERRLIVEALVVRKMSIEEATLDFGRLALI